MVRKLPVVSSRSSHRPGHLEALRSRLTKPVLVGLATLLLIPLPSAAAATSSPPDPSVSRPAGLVAGILERLPFGEDTLEQLLRDRAQRRTCGCDVVYPVNDLDGDRRADIAAITIHESSDGASRSTIDVISSRRASSLFTAPVGVPGYARVLPTRVDGAPALLYYAIDYRYVAGSYEGRLQAGALGAGGSRLWERSWELPWTWATVRYQRWLEDLAFITDKDGIAVGLALAISESLSPPGIVKLHLEQVSAADGQTEAARTTREQDDLEDVTLTPFALKGKIHDALAIQVNPIGGNKESLLVHTSLGEDPLWALKVKEYAWLEAAANVIGDAGNELVLSQGWGKRYALQALDAMTGEVAWEGSVPGQVVDDAGGDGRSDLVQIKQLGKQERRWRLTRVELPGRVLWSEDVSVRRHHRYANWTSFYVDAWGDVDEDGVSEVRAYMTSYQDDGDHLRYLSSERALIDGENGRTLTQASLYLPLIGTLDGRGSDSLTFDLREQEVEITGRDGVDGSALWHQRIAIEAAAKLDPCRWGYYIVDGGDSDDVLVVIPRREGGDEEVLIDGSTGNVVWRLDPAGAV